MVKNSTLPGDNKTESMKTEDKEENKIEKQAIYFDRAQLAQFNSQQKTPLWPSLLEAPILIDKPLNRPQTADDEFIYWSN